MLRIGAVSGNERMPAAHETTQSVHFGAGAFIPLQDVEKEKAAPSTWRPEFAERRSGAARAHCSHRPAGPERATANKPRWRGKNVRCASAICRADPGRLAPLDEKKATLLFAVTAWNYCLISSEEQAHMRWELRHIFNNAHNRADFEMLIQRKTELYPRNRRLFMGLEVAESAAGLHVNVVSTDLDRMG
jgi:hypothetical protein